MALQIERIPSEEEDQEFSAILYRIASYPADYTLEVLYTWWQAGDILIPPFQRSFVWTQAQASRLIDSFLMGLPVPEIFLFKDQAQRMLVIDGQQRLRTVFSFFDEKLPDGRRFYLTGITPRWEGKTFSTLDASDTRRLKSATLRTIFVEQLDPKDSSSVYHIFERLNTGGTTLNAQEVRNCVYHGTFNDMLMRLNAADSDWRRIMGSPKPDTRLRDVELLLRFLAMVFDMNNYAKPMKDFLSGFMNKHKAEADLSVFEDVFRKTSSSVVSHLGERPFHVTRGLNAAAFDAVMHAFATARRSPPPDVRNRYRNTLLKNESFIESISAGTTDVAVLRRRLGLAEQVLFR